MQPSLYFVLLTGQPGEKNMKLLYFLLGALILAVGPQAVMAQCCCSSVKVTVTNGAGFPLDVDDVKAREVSERLDGSRVWINSDEKKKARINYHIGCGNGREVMVVENQGVEMRIRFKFNGDFGRVELDVPFAAGDHVVEFEKEWSEYDRRKAVIRPADSEEAKEAEEIQKANAAAAKDKAANAPGSDPSP